MTIEEYVGQRMIRAARGPVVRGEVNLQAPPESQEALVTTVGGVRMSVFVLGVHDIDADPVYVV
jgi:hypothetical protein